MVTIDDYAIDAALTEELEREAETTKFPISKKGQITDHVILNPTIVRIHGIVSDTPIGPIADRRFTVGDFKPSNEALATLETIFEAKDAVTVVGNLKTYENMIMTSLSVPVDANTGEALMFTATFQQIQVEENQRVTVEVTLTKQGKGNRASQPPGWIGTDKKGRDIVASQLGPGIEPQYTRADGTPVSADEARDAARKNDAVLVKYDSNGNAVPVNNQDYQPYTPKQRTSWWSPTPRKN